ncbi:insulinase family protein [Cutibacterium sp. WCA-380-WT-3A]|uniref:Insulinase family protein n=1 Tax=Cutibacterium porci TaxID=2605781 RepID=A0A7K0J4B8_9ACTN|nr:pitrilysin family protein [Cutibacterium porci]MSS44774.1 insulinase family protein [Cutibacterium porci]
MLGPMPEPLQLHRATLDNGMRVVVNPDATSPGVAVNMWYRVGSADEEVGHFGFAHLFEHLMFSGTTSGIASSEHLATIEAVGGSANASTSFDRTNYFETVPAGGLELALWLEAERLAHLAVTEDNLTTQREVVKEEKRQRYDNTPYGDLLDLLLDGRFGDEHPYGHPTIGSVTDLDAARLDDVTAFHSAWYRPDNAVLVICGCVEASEGLALADTYLGAVPAASGDIPQRIQRRVRHDNPRVIVTRHVPRTAVTRSWATPPITDPDNLAVAMAVDVLGSGMSSRLIRILERERHLVDGVGMNDLGLARGASTTLVSAHLKPGVSEEELTGAVDEIITELAAHGPSRAELERARAQVERGWLESFAIVDERADVLNMYESLLGDANLVNTYLSRVQAVTADDIAEAAKRWLSPNQASTVVHKEA